MFRIASITLAVLALAPATALAGDCNEGPPLQWHVTKDDRGVRLAQLQFNGNSGSPDRPMRVTLQQRDRTITRYWSNVQVRSFSWRGNRRTQLRAYMNVNRSYYSNFEDVQNGAPSFIEVHCPFVVPGRAGR
jgi:hypothetical protein